MREDGTTVANSQLAKKTPPTPLPAWEVGFTLAGDIDGWNERSAASVSSKPALATGFAFGRLDRFHCLA
jgi:hypothetical protein